MLLHTEFDIYIYDNCLFKDFRYRPLTYSTSSIFFVREIYEFLKLLKKASKKQQKIVYLNFLCPPRVNFQETFLRKPHISQNKYEEK